MYISKKNKNIKKLIKTIESDVSRKGDNKLPKYADMYNMTYPASITQYI